MRTTRTDCILTLNEQRDCADLCNGGAFNTDAGRAGNIARVRYESQGLQLWLRQLFIYLGSCSPWNGIIYIGAVMLTFMALGALGVRGYRRVYHPPKFDW